MRHCFLPFALLTVLTGCANQAASVAGGGNGTADSGSAASSSGPPAADAGGSHDAARDDATLAPPVDAGSGVDGASPDMTGDSATGGVDAGDGGFTLPISDAGCSVANSPTGSLNLTSIDPDGGLANYIVTLPNGYGGKKAFPLVFGFHGRNRTNEQFVDVDALDIKTEITPFAVMVYPQSQGGPGWEMAPELPLNIPFFEALWRTMFANYCIDAARVFVIGHSSGAMFSNILACRYGDRLRGVGAVAGEQLETACVGNVAAMIVHGGADPIVPTEAGIATRDFEIQRNGCQTTSTPGQVAPCVAYDGCLPGLPVEWCEHTEPTYTMTDGGGHGYPTFASKAFWGFFSPLPPKTTK